MFNSSGVLGNGNRLREKKRCGGYSTPLEFWAIKNGEKTLKNMLR